MKIDNKLNIYKIWLRKFLSTIILTILIIVVGFTEFFKSYQGIDRIWFLIILAVLYIMYVAYNFFLHPCYVYFSDNSDKIILRYYPTRIFNRKKNSIEIPKQSFISWEVQKFFMGFGEKLFLSGKYKTGIIKFPGVSLSAVNPDDRKKILSTLNQYVKRR